jgi:hypothetical protein
MTDGTALDPRVTARAFLFGEGREADTAEVLSRAIAERGLAASTLHGIRRLSGSARGMVDREVGAAADNLLDIDLGDALVSGWRKHSELKESARRTLAMPGSEDVVVLARHQVTAVHHPQVDLMLDEIKLNTFEFDLTAVFDLTGLSAVVKAGDLVALQGGSCLVTVTLDLEGARLAEGRRQVDLNILVHLQPAIALIDKAEHLNPPSPA